MTISQVWIHLVGIAYLNISLYFYIKYPFIYKYLKEIFLKCYFFLHKIEKNFNTGHLDYQP